MAQENICKALVDAYANFSSSRRYLQDMINKRNSTITALLTSFDTYDDLLGKANKGIEFYNKLETNVSKLLQRIRSACKVQEEEREQMLAKATVKNVEPAVKTSVSATNAPKLKDYLDSMKKDPGQFTIPTYPGGMEATWPPGVRPAPLGSEMNVESALPVSSNEQGRHANYSANAASMGYIPSSVQTPYGSNSSGTGFGYNYGIYPDQQYSSSYQQQIPTVSQQQQQQQSTISQQLPGAMQQSYSSQQQQPTASAQLPAVIPQQNYSFQEAAVAQQLPTAVQQQSYSSQQQAALQQLPAAMQQQNYSSQQLPAAIQQQSYGSQQTAVSQQIPAAMQHQNYSSQQQPVFPQHSTLSQLPVLPQQPTATQLPPQPQPTPPPQVPLVQQPTLSPLPNVQHLATVPQVPQQATQLPSTGYPYPPQSPLPTSGQEKNIDDVLSERMAALLSSKKQTVSTLNDFPLNQYSQFGYNPQTTPTYSATNYSYPTITQAYTITSSYQNVPTISQQSGSYPTTVSESANYSVAPSINAPHYSVPPSSTPQPYPAAYCGAANTSYTNYIPQNYAAPSMPGNGVNSLSYSTNVYNGQQGYYQNYQSTDSGASNQPYVYGSMDQNTSTEQSQYPSYYPQSTTVVPQTTAAYPENSYGVYTQAGTSNYYNDYYQNTVTSTTATSSYGTKVSTGNISATEKTSNIDLLSGLDFTINQVPLTPQPTLNSATEPETKERKEGAKAKTEPAPAVVSSKESVEKKLLELKKPQYKLLELPKRNQLENPETFKQFVQEAEKYEKFVDTLTAKTLNGPTTLEVKWKEIVDKQDVDVQKRSISVARCYPMKNRSPDILPYDYSRVELITTKDDYINASHIRDVTPYTPPFIVTQCPMSATIADFWTMVWEQQVELIVCLLSDNKASVLLKYSLLCLYI